MCTDGSMLSKLFRVAIFGTAGGYGGGGGGSGSKAGAAPIVQATSNSTARKPLTAEELEEASSAIRERLTHLGSKKQTYDDEVVAIAMRGESKETINALTNVIVQRRKIRGEMKGLQGKLSILETIHSRMSSSRTNAAFADIVNRAAYQLEAQNPEIGEDRIADVMSRLQNGVDAADRLNAAMGQEITTDFANQDQELSIEEEVRQAFAAANAQRATQSMAGLATPPTAAVRVTAPPPAAAAAATSGIRPNQVAMPAMVYAAPQGVVSTGGTFTVPRGARSATAQLPIALSTPAPPAAVTPASTPQLQNQRPASNMDEWNDV